MSATAGRLEELKRLHDQRLITDEEYESSAARSLIVCSPSTVGPRGVKGK